jgi:hypothetical protein
MPTLSASLRPRSIVPSPLLAAANEPLPPPSINWPATAVMTPPNMLLNFDDLLGFDTLLGALLVVAADSLLAVADAPAGAPP